MAILVYRRGVSLIELLVVLGVIGILAGLLLPAVQISRESARRTICLGNLRQIGIGLHDYHSIHRRFPVGGFDYRPYGNTTNKNFAWSAFLLPQLDEANVYDQIDFSLPFDSAVNQQAGQVRVSVYLCPSSRRTRLENQLAPTDYGGIFGERISSPNSPPKGTMLYDQFVSARDIVDGLAATLIVGEDSRSTNGQWINGWNLFDQAFAINSGPDFENDLRSEHPGGVSGCFADGHVQFLNEQLSLPTLAAICTRDQRDQINENEF